VEGPGGFYVPAVIDDDSPSPRAVVGRILGLAIAGYVLVLGYLLIATGRLEWQLVAFTGILRAAKGFLSGLIGNLFEPAGKFVLDQLTGNVAPIGPSETLAEQTAHTTKADALLARLRAKYPEHPELELAGSD
jgi:hypothetical protein